jgi:hypothetical protein
MHVGADHAAKRKPVTGRVPVHATQSMTMRALARIAKDFASPRGCIALDRVPASQTLPARGAGREGARAARRAVTRAS